MADRELIDPKSTKMFDHPIFIESIKFIQAQLGSTGLNSLQQQVLERIIHTSGDFQVLDLLTFSPEACQIGISALKGGAVILTDTTMAAAAVTPMAKRTLQNEVRCVLEWAPSFSSEGLTRTSEGMRKAWLELNRNKQDKPPIVLIGSAPKALETLLDLASTEGCPPSLIVGMPVGFIGVSESKERLVNSGLPYILLKGSRGGAALAAASINALMRASFLPNH